MTFLEITSKLLLASLLEKFLQKETGRKVIVIEQIKVVKMSLSVNDIERHLQNLAIDRWLNWRHFRSHTY